MIDTSKLLNRPEISFDEIELTSHYRNKTILITGACGSIGSEILNQLLKIPVKKIIAFDNSENGIHHLNRRFCNDKRFFYIIGDIKTKTKIENVIKRYKPSIVFHAGAYKHVPIMEKHPDEAVLTNVIGTYNCVMASIKNGVDKFVFISTDKAVKPTSIMGMSKRIAEKIVLSANNIGCTKFILTRFGNVLGSSGSVLEIFEEQIKNNQPLTITHPEITRFFMTIPEASKLVIKAGSLDEGKIFILDMGEPIKILDLAKKLLELYGLKNYPITIIERKGDKRYEEILLESENLIQTKYEKL